MTSTRTWMLSLIALGLAGLGLCQLTREPLEAAVFVPAEPAQVAGDATQVHGSGPMQSRRVPIDRTPVGARTPLPPADLLAAWAASRAGRDGGTYLVMPHRDHPAPDALYEANNRAQGLRIGFASKGIRVASRRSTAPLRMELVSIGYGDRRQSIRDTALIASGQRVDYHRTTDGGATLTEWYVNEAKGLEQGFTLHAPVGVRTGQQPVVIELTCSGGAGGWSPQLREGGSTIAFTSANEEATICYSGLCSYDAEGTELRSRMVVGERSVELVVDDADAIYPITVDPTFTEENKLTASGGAAGQLFGWHVDVDGRTAVIAAPDDDVLTDVFMAETKLGAAYVFERNSSGTWQQRKKLAPNDAAIGDNFGERKAVAISGDTVIVGAPGRDISGPGAAYVFERDQGGSDNWGQAAKLTASDGLAFDSFGFNVDVSGDTVVIGAPSDDGGRGSAYVFERNHGGQGNWGCTAKLTAAQRDPADYFGEHVGIDGDTILAANYGEDTPTTDAGAVYVFYRNKGGTNKWGEAAKLVASDPVPYFRLGFNLEIDGDTAILGHAGDRNAVYVFERNHGGVDNWGQVAKWTASTAVLSFGVGVAISENYALIGASNALGGSGATYVFRRDRRSNQWEEVGELVAGNPWGGFGQSVAIDRGLAIIGAPYDAELGSGAGAIYAVQLDENPYLLVLELIDEVEGMVDQGARKRMLAILNDALSLLGANKTTAAISKLNAFIKGVRAMRGTKIPVADADSMIAAAETILALLEQ